MMSLVRHLRFNLGAWFTAARQHWERPLGQHHGQTAQFDRWFHMCHVDVFTYTSNLCRYQYINVYMFICICCSLLLWLRCQPRAPFRVSNRHLDPLRCSGRGSILLEPTPAPDGAGRTVGSIPNRTRRIPEDGPPFFPPENEIKHWVGGGPFKSQGTRVKSS